MKKAITLAILVAIQIHASETYHLMTDFSSIPSFLDNDNMGVLKDETSNGKDILKDCNAINPSRYDKCYYPMGDLRNERDGWLNNNNGIKDECVQQPGSGISDCPEKVECEPDDEDCKEVPYNRLADWTKCGDWKSGGKLMLLSWMECNYDSLHFRKSDQYLSIEDIYVKENGATTITKEAQRMYNSAIEFKNVVKKGNENTIPLFGIRHFGYWPHKEFVDKKELGNTINTLQSDISINTLEQQAFLTELMATELSIDMENVLYREKHKY